MRKFRQNLNLSPQNWSIFFFFLKAHLSDAFFYLKYVTKYTKYTKNRKRLCFTFWRLKFLKKIANKPFSSNLSNIAQKRSTQSFKKEIETRKKGLSFYFLKIKKCLSNYNKKKSYKSLKLNFEKTEKCTNRKNRSPGLWATVKSKLEIFNVTDVNVLIIVCSFNVE